MTAVFTGPTLIDARAWDSMDRVLHSPELVADDLRRGALWGVTEILDVAYRVDAPSRSR